MTRIYGAWPRATRYAAGRWPVIAVALVIGTACSDRPPTAVYGDASQLLGSVQADKHAINLVLNETAQITPSAFTVGGDPITDLTGLQITSTAAARVSVTNTGLITARDITDGAVPILLRFSKDSVTRVDTVLVYVRDTPITPQRFVFRLTEDSARVGVGSAPDMESFIITAAGDTIDDIVTRVTSSDPTIVFINRYSIYSYLNTRSFGKAKVYASTTIAGQTFQDSVEIEVGYAAEGSFGWNGGRWNYPDPLQFVVQRGATLWWYNWGSETATAVTFDNPAAALASPDDPNGGSGNIPAFSGTRHGRRFVTAGTYKWQSGSQSGTVIVMPTFGPQP